MLRVNLKQVSEKLKKVYYEYLTDYLLFSGEYTNLIEEGLLDVYIESQYIYYLHAIVSEINDANLYPSHIIYNFLEILSLLEVRTNEILSENEKQSLKPLFEEMYGKLSDVSKNDEMEIYYIEFIKRYSNMESNNIRGILVKQLELDIQKDYLYLDILINDGVGKIEYIGDDFGAFLQKLMIDFPEAKDHPIIKKSIKDIIKAKNDPKLNAYLNLLKDKYVYKNNIGFNFDTMEMLYCNTLLKKLIFLGNTKELLKEIDPKVLYTIPFFNNLCNELTIYLNKNEISVQEKEAYQEIIYFMRNNLDCCLPIYKKHYIDLFNEWIKFLNKSDVIADVMPIYSSCLIKCEEFNLLDSFKFYKNESEYKVKANLEVELIYDIMKCFFGEDNLEELKEGGIYTISALTYIFNEYPKMFFEPTIHEKAMQLIESIDCKKSQKLKTRIRRMRK